MFDVNQICKVQLFKLKQTIKFQICLYKDLILLTKINYIISQIYSFQYFLFIKPQNFNNQSTFDIRSVPSRTQLTKYTTSRIFVSYSQKKFSFFQKIMQKSKTKSDKPSKSDPKVSNPLRIINYVFANFDKKCRQHSKNNTNTKKTNKKNYDIQKTSISPKQKQKPAFKNLFFNPHKPYHIKKDKFKNQKEANDDIHKHFSFQNDSSIYSFKSRQMRVYVDEQDKKHPKMYQQTKNKSFEFNSSCRTNISFLMKQKNNYNTSKSSKRNEFSQIIDENNQSPKTTKSKSRTVFEHFNLKYIIDKKKTLNFTHENQIKGSNMPYFQSFSAQETQRKSLDSKLYSGDFIQKMIQLSPESHQNRAIPRMKKASFVTFDQKGIIHEKQTKSKLQKQKNNQ